MHCGVCGVIMMMLVRCVGAARNNRGPELAVDDAGEWFKQPKRKQHNQPDPCASVAQPSGKMAPLAIDCKSSLLHVGSPLREITSMLYNFVINVSNNTVAFMVKE